MRRPGGELSRIGNRALRTVLVIALGASALVGVQSLTPNTTPAVAADLSQFRPGNIISDELFFNPNAMTAAEIQTFLNSKVSTCQPGYTCLKDFTQTTFTIAATPMCSTYAGAANETAATIIYKVSQACGISPKVILVKLQKEQSLVTTTAPSSGRYRSAMGAGCPDTAACDTNYYGFFQQVHYGAYLLKRYTQPPGTGAGTPWPTRYDLWRPVGQVSQLRLHPNVDCGTTPVFIENQATHSLYIYTPYTPNQAALNAGYGIGDVCSSYGNRNFFHFYTDWFGSTQAPALVNLSGNALIRGVTQIGQYLHGTAGSVSPIPETVSCAWLRNGVPAPEISGCVHQLTTSDIGQQFSVTVTSTRAGYRSLTQTSAQTPAISEPQSSGSDLNPISPARIAETRLLPGEGTEDALVQGSGAIGPGQVLRIPITGRVGIPSGGVGAVAVNVTAILPTEDGFLTVFPTGESPPLASNLNFSAGEVVANSVIARVGADGSISIYNPNGSTHVAVDISGWFPATESFTSISPTRIAETRNLPGEGTIDDLIQGVGAIGPGETLDVPVLGRAGVPLDNVGAIAVNLTAIAPSAEGFLTVFPTGETPPLASNLNFSAGEVVANSVIARVGANGSISIYNPNGSTHVAVDISGWFPATESFTSISPTRIAETRNLPGEGTIDDLIQGVGAIGPGETLRIPVVGRAGIPSNGVAAVAVNLTAILPTAEGFLTVFPTAQARPLASNVNFTQGEVVANTVIARVGSDGSISVYNPNGSTHVAVDISGWFPTGNGPG